VLNSFWRRHCHYYFGAGDWTQGLVHTKHILPSGYSPSAFLNVRFIYIILEFVYICEICL
jgi:hypothetical protein